jgi:hypothetical protein
MYTILSSGCVPFFKKTVSKNLNYKIMWGALIGAGISAGAQYLANRHNRRTQLEQQNALNAMDFRYNTAMLNAQQQSQYEMWLKTNYSEQVKQMRAAGLNPALMYAGGGSGGITGNASGGNFHSQAGKDTDRDALGLQKISQVMQAMLLKSQKENLDADTELKKANASKLSGVDTDFAKSQIGVNSANIKQIESLTRNTDLRSEGQLVTNELLKLQKQYEEGTLDARILQATLTNQNLQLNIDKLSAELPYVGNIAKATLENLEQQTKTGKSVEGLNKAKTSDQDFENSEIQRQLRTAKTISEVYKIMNENDITTEKLNMFKKFGVVPEGVDGRFMSLLIRVLQTFEK